MKVVEQAIRLSSACRSCFDVDANADIGLHPSFVCRNSFKDRRSAAVSAVCLALKHAMQCCCDLMPTALLERLCVQDPVATDPAADHGARQSKGLVAISNALERTIGLFAKMFKLQVRITKSMIDEKTAWVPPVFAELVKLTATTKHGLRT